MPMHPPTKSKPQSNQPLSFEVAEFTNYDRGIVWYGGVLIFFAVLIFSSILLKVLDLGLILLLAAVVFYQLALANPDKVRLTLDSKGLTFKDKFYSWSIFHSFSVFGSGKHATLRLDKLDTWQGSLVIPLPSTSHLTDKHKDFTDKDVVVVAIRSILPERLHGEQFFGDWFLRIFRF